MLATPLYLCGVVDSVLDLAHAFVADSSLPVWGGVLAASQRCGRGQMRREWSSPPGNIYAALRLPLTQPFASDAAALMVGVLLAEACKRQGIDIVLKWPNDLLLCSPHKSPIGKVGGILLEERAGALIAGIGINVASAPSPGQIRHGGLPAACLHDLPRSDMQGKDVLPALWFRLVDSFILCYHQWKKLDWHAWLTRAERRLAWKGEQIVLDDGERRQGIFLGLAASGGVRLLCKGVEQEFLSGTLSPVHL